ncbi:thioredoxin-disulfide reductase [Dietzia sp.]|uniref:thioredoxin-disulfide reductase n=1 Tax=Dietzia sp. TaxID=1871616 RepID=UPI002FDB8586
MTDSGFSIQLDADDPAEPTATPSGSAADPDQVHDVIIVGSGPAGYTAAIYAARAELAPLVFEGLEYGGALMTTTEVENFPGFPEGIQGPDLMSNMREQAERFGADLRMEEVTRLELTGEIKKVHVGEDVYAARSVILSMGAAARYLGVEGEQEYLGRGVSSCATCDGFFFKDKPIAVIGGGDSAMEEAGFLSRFGTKVTLIHRRDEFRASKIMEDRVRANEKVDILTNKVVARVEGDDAGAVRALKLTDTVTGAESELDTAAMFVAIGHDPRSGLVSGQVDLDSEGYVLAGSGAQASATNLPGVFACGDLVDKRYQQAVTAAGSGCTAALDAEHYLASLGAK